MPGAARGIRLRMPRLGQPPRLPLFNKLEGLRDTRPQRVRLRAVADRAIAPRRPGRRHRGPRRDLPGTTEAATAASSGYPGARAPSLAIAFGTTETKAASG